MRAYNFFKEFLANIYICSEFPILYNLDCNVVKKNVKDLKCLLLIYIYKHIYYSNVEFQVSFSYTINSRFS